MRNAAAQFDDDFAFEEPARKSRKRRPRDAGALKRSRSRKRKTPYVRYAAIGLSAVLAIGIVFNAVALQQSRHPAPLFGKAVTLADDSQPVSTPAPVKVASLAPETKPRTVEQKALEQKAIERKVLEPTGSITALLSRVSPAPKATPAPRPRHLATETPPPVARAKLDDPIGKMLKNPVVASNEPVRISGKDTGRDAAKESGKTILAAQHALMKLGFVVKPNGAFSPATRAAIEAFERDQHLPVKGELTRKLLKQLSAESGVAID